jgi:aspartyl-tRNA(Asn)/glutamyl-tRNA(Gln) amidotransferase subunit A
VTAVAAPPDLLTATVAELGVAYRSGDVSPVDVVERSLERIRERDGEINAWITVLGERAVAAAREAEGALAGGRDLGPLHGIPVALKDNVATAGVETTCASRIRRGFVPVADADVVTRLREAGAIVLGKTNLLEFAYGIVHPDFGQCNNPLDTGRTSGGSSSGSCAAVADGMVPLAVGTDTGGSIRVPAAYCGVVGLKPTYDLVSRRGVFPLSWSLDHVGPIARTGADAALLLRAMAGERLPAAGAPAPGLRGLRVGVPDEHLGADVRPRVRAAFDRALADLERAGALVAGVSVPSLALADDALFPIFGPEAAAVHEEWMRTRPQDYAPMTRTQLELGLLVPATDYVRAQRFRSLLRSEFDRAFAAVDVVVAPTVAWVAPAEDPAIAGDDGAVEARRTGPYNLTGHPAVTVPCGPAEDGLPAGLQFAGPSMTDRRLLAVAAAYEEVRS